MTVLPEVIRCDRVGSFPWSVLHDRHPKIVAQVRAAHPYPPEVLEALDLLLDEMLGGVVTPLPATAHDARDWEIFGDMAAHAGRSWYEAPFLWAECYFYRRLLHAVGYFAPGEWREVDPFAPAKRDELAAAALDLDPAHLVAAAVWGNRGDLGFLASVPGARDAAREDALVVDDTGALWSFLDRGGLRVGYAADNAGGELLHDLVLIDHLLSSGMAGEVTLYLKRYPFFVSDAVQADLAAALLRLRGEAPEVARRLLEAYGGGRLTVNDQALFTMAGGYADWPRGEVRYAFRDLDVTVLKGDLNYRRLVGDRYWRGTEDFAGLVEHFPTPVVTLHAVKSEAVVGVPADTLAALDAADPGWRLTGRHAMVQARL